ncbi:hypothetical protein UB35_04045 [Photobacterium angustum]|nr:hypothetical protein UB35_04045 [Photobacterium angustum]PSV62771.1 hypothetical protein CTM95_19800 [Photobacterium angustum]
MNKINVFYVIFNQPIIQSEFTLIKEYIQLCKRKNNAPFKINVRKRYLYRLKNQVLHILKLKKSDLTLFHLN